MDSFFSKKSCFRKASEASVLALATLIISSVTLPNPAAFAQATNTSGSIQGTITDASGAALPGATVTITSAGTGQATSLKTDSAGIYRSGPLVPGSYTIVVSASGFSQVKTSAVVQISSITPGNYRLAVGGSSEVVEVQGNAVAVNPDQTNVQSVITPEQIQNLPVQGRNFLDLAQLEPGVQLQSGETFDPTKAGYSALSMGGVSGRTTRILLDGSDITDETVGTTIFNVPSGAIGEFQLNRSTGDVSGDITSSGSVFVATPSGTNAFHGQGLYYFQDQAVGAADAGGGILPPFQRNQFGGYAGGPIIKDKLFIFGDLERIKQDAGQAVTLAPVFSGITSANPYYGSPFRDTYSVLRMDYDGPWGVHYFARANYEVNSVASTFGYGYSRYANRDNTPGLSVGADFVTGKFTHSFRGGYEKFHNLISDASGSGVFNPIPSIELTVPGSGLYTGPNLLAPQQTYQSEKQFRYDGSWTKGSHSFRYGASLNRILGGGFASFFGIAPLVQTVPSSQATNPSDPTSYLPDFIQMGNGQGYSTEIPSFGQPSGGQGDWRTGAYIADAWKITPTFTLSAGLRWSRDTGRSDSDLAPIPCSEIDTTAFPTPPCSGNQLILDQFGAGLGDRVNQPNVDFGPQLGFAYAPGALNGKTVLRGGIGLYYENFVFNNVLFDRPAKLAKGLFFGEAGVQCPSPAALTVNGAVVAGGDAASLASLCSEPVSVSGPGFAAVERSYQAAVAKAGAAANSSFVGETLSIPQNSDLLAYAPHTFTSPRSVHINFGIQQQIGRGIVVSGDYLHQVDWKFMQNQDMNFVGNPQYYDPIAAAAAVSNTVTQCGVGSVDAAIASCPGLHSDGSGATIVDFSAPAGGGAGLGSGVELTGGGPSAGIAAFPGKNPKMGQGMFQFPNGRSAYDALQLQFKMQRSNPLPGLVASNFEASYNYSRFVTTAGGANGSDQYFSATSWNWNSPTQNIGPGSLDRPQQLSFGGYATAKYGPQIGLIAHFSSAIPTSMILDNLSGTTGQLFQTDIFGTGNTNANFTTGQLAPGTEPGSYMRTYHGKNLNNYINYFNGAYAGTLTPAGKVVVNSGVLSAAQMARMGGVIQQIAPAPTQAIQNGMLKEIDANFAYPINFSKLHEGLSLVPSVAFYNVGNFANYGGPANGILLNSADAGSSGYLNGPSTFADRGQFRTERGSGTFNLGGPRTTEFQLKLNF